MCPECDAFFDEQVDVGATDGSEADSEVVSDGELEVAAARAEHDRAVDDGSEIW